jgi:hypothetical protein
MTISKKCEYTLVRKRLYFDSQLFKIDRCCKFLGTYRPRIYSNMSTLHVAVLRTQALKSRCFFVAIARGLSTMRRK